MLPTLLLTAGLGTRLDPLTRLVAKPAVPLAGRSLIERVLGGLVRQGVTDVVLNLHHRPETITAIVGDGAHLGLRVRYSWEQPVLGSAGGPRRALPLLDAARFAIVNGDTLSGVDLASLIAFHDRAGAAATMAVVKNPAPHHYNGVAVDEEGRVTAFVPKGAGAAGTYHFIGVQIVEASVFASLADGVPAETVWGVYREMVAREPGRVRAVPVDTPFDDVGTASDYLRSALRLAGGGDGAAVIEGDAHRIPRSARLARTIVWRDAGLGPDVSLDGCVVAGPVSVPAGFHATGAVLVPAAIVRSGDDRARVAGDLAIFPI